MLIVLGLVNSVRKMLGFVKTKKKYTQKDIDKTIAKEFLKDFK